MKHTFTLITALLAVAPASLLATDAFLVKDGQLRAEIVLSRPSKTSPPSSLYYFLPGFAGSRGGSP